MRAFLISLCLCGSAVLAAQDGRYPTLDIAFSEISLPAR